jgi:hypothetical protein
MLKSCRPPWRAVGENPFEIDINTIVVAPEIPFPDRPGSPVWFLKADTQGVYRLRTTATRYLIVG